MLAAFRALSALVVVFYMTTTSRGVLGGTTEITTTSQSHAVPRWGRRKRRGHGVAASGGRWGVCGWGAVRSGMTDI